MLFRSSGLTLRGWALEPSGVESVKVHVGTLEKDARIGEASPEAGLLRVKTIFSGYPDAATAGFAVDLSADELARAGAPNPLTLKVFVQGKNGATTEIDRRNLLFAAAPPPASDPAPRSDAAATSPPK